MYNKSEAAAIRKHFWTSYGKSFPRKWLLYNTKIKGFSFKFYADNQMALVTLDIEPKNQTKRELLYQQIKSLQQVTEKEYISNIIFEENYVLETGKVISRIYVKSNQNFNIYDKNSWSTAFEFFNEKMTEFELWFYEFEDYIKEANI